MLYMLGQRELARTLLPVGELTKAEVRAHAARLGLRTATKAESMDVCFITRGGREPFLDARIGRRTRVRSSTPTARSSARTTASPRSRSGSAAASASRPAERRYVVDVDAARRRSPSATARDLLRDSVVAARPHVRRRVTAGRADLRRRCAAHGAPIAATLDGTTCASHTPQPRVAPGQVVALYDGRRAGRRRDRHLTRLRLPDRDQRTGQPAFGRPYAASRRGGRPRP